MKILIFGDIFGDNGIKAFNKYLQKLKQDHKPNMIFINGENLDKGHGITKKQYKDMMALGVSVVTMGNHTFRKRELFDFIEGSKIIRPINYPETVKGSGRITVKYNDKLVTVIN